MNENSKNRKFYYSHIDEIEDAELSPEYEPSPKRKRTKQTKQT